ncbi:MAG: hypothetical protein RLZZ150_328 [Bacteroidota bacterium]|jgi:uncharacterized protein (DUF2164 family)
MISFSPEQRNELIQRLRTYCETDLSIELGRFDAEFLVDFFTREIGPASYNQGLFDAVAMLDKRVDDLRESMLTLEQHREG